VVQPLAPVRVPELRPLQVPAAARALAAAGLHACRQPIQHVKPSAFVVSQSPVPGVLVPAGSCVTVVLADGVEVPDLVGLTTNEAKKPLDLVFLTLAPATGSGKILSQRPEPHVIVRPRTRVVVTLEVVVVPPTGTTQTQGTTGPPNPSDPTSTDSPTPSPTEPTPTPTPTATVHGGIEPVGYAVPFGATLVGVLALLAVFVVGRRFPRRPPGRRETGGVPAQDGSPDVPAPSEPSPPVPSQQPHAFDLRVRADKGSDLRLVDADAVAAGRAGLTSTPDPTLELSLVEELS
jgi:hypothetical protein